jgi:hypothetical protein
VVTNKQLVYWHGRLKKDGRAVRCTVQVWEIGDPEGGPPAYARHRIIKAPKRLADGLYDLETHDQKLRVRRVNGFWLAEDADPLEDEQHPPARIARDIVAVGAIVSAMLIVFLVLRQVGIIAIR